ncbi:MAG: FAD:protein FMN transferase [Lachnospiraceae bacterium]|nr:FAD:protein FMN transferase [Lachnospiraceae bacterium]
MKQMQKTFFALGTANSVSVFYEEKKEALIMETLNHIKSRTLLLDDMFSVFKENSEITKINKAAGKKLVEVSPETYKIIQRAIEFSEVSRGAFDITAGSLSRLWRKAKKENRVPDSEEIKKQKELTNYKKIIMDDNKVGLSQGGQEIDLGGIAKGYAADEAKKILMEANIMDAIINFGGSIISIGDEKQIGIQNPDATTGITMGRLKVKGQAAVTSGLYERYFIKSGNQYHHLIDPKTGMPSQSGLLSVTLIGDSALEMDALSTAVFVAGLEDGMKILEKYNTEVIVIDAHRDIFLTRGLVDKFAKDKEEIGNNE